MTGQRPVGVLGGTFDPIHRGHVALARHAHARLGLDHVRLVPSHVPPHRPPTVADAPARWAMVQLAAAAHAGLVADDIELRRPGPSYMVRTLADMRQRVAGPLVLLLGRDAFADLARWWHWRELFEHAHIAVFSRPDAPPLADPDLLREVAARRGDCRDGAAAGTVQFCDDFTCAVAASTIRARIHAAQPVDRLLPGAVLGYIQQHGLYS